LDGAELAWKTPLPSQGIGGIAATDEFVIVTARDRSDSQDVICCLDAESGIAFWQHSYQATGNLDYGNSIRATALIADPWVITLGAFGDLNCLDLETGEVVWSKHMVRDLGGTMPQWGYAASPFAIEGRLIVQPGGDSASMVALDLETGDLCWKVPGRQAAYASLVEWFQGDKRQLIGFDYRTFGGWDATDGKRLWEVTPAIKNDFNVPTPLVFDSGLVVTSENNGTRFHAWNEHGGVTSAPSAEYPDLAGDTHTPILLGKYVVGVDRGLHVLDTENQLRRIDLFNDGCLDGYCSLIGSQDRVMVQCENGEVLLLQVNAKGVQEIGRMRVGDSNVQILAHPAMVDTLYLVRLPDQVQAWRFPNP
jgi:outer membrane protein assembly factor BamB